MGGRLAVVLGALVALAAAQIPDAAESRKGRPLDAVREAMDTVRAGACDAGCIAEIVAALLESEHAIAAPWWLALVSEDKGPWKPLPEERDRLAKLRRAIEAPEWFAAERKVMLRVVRHVEALVAAKEFTEAREAVRAAAALLDLVPDPALARLLDAARAKVPPPATDDPGAKGAKWPRGLGDEMAATYSKVAERALVAYGVAGCRPGRYIVTKSLRDATEMLPEGHGKAWLDRLRILAATVEPRSGLTFLVRTAGGATVFREGVPIGPAARGAPLDAETHEPVTIPVLPGDLVTIAFDSPYAADETSRAFVIAFNGRFEDRDLGRTDLFCDLSANPGLGGAPPFPVPIALKRPDPPKTLFGRSPEQDEALRAFKTYFELPKTTHRALDVPCFGDMIMFLAEFDRRKLAPTLIGTETSHFALVIRVPSERP